jgi:DNA-binding NarL/FixJ family response regulator
VPDARLVFLSHFFSDALLDRALRLNVRGLFLTDDPEDQLRDGLRKAARGETAFSARLADHFEPDRKTGEIRVKHYTRLSHLTIRQMSVLQRLACGQSPAEIAQALSISPSAVNNHKSALMKKLHIHDRVELTIFAIAEGLAVPLHRRRGKDS